MSTVATVWSTKRIGRCAMVSAPAFGACPASCTATSATTAAAISSRSSNVASEPHCSATSLSINYRDPHRDRVHLAGLSLHVAVPLPAHPLSYRLSSTDGRDGPRASGEPARYAISSRDRSRSWPLFGRWGIAGPHRQARPHAAGAGRVELVWRIRHEHDGLRCDAQALGDARVTGGLGFRPGGRVEVPRSGTASDRQPRNAGRAAAGRGSSPTRRCRRDVGRRASATGPPARRERPRRRDRPARTPLPRCVPAAP